MDEHNLLYRCGATSQKWIKKITSPIGQRCGILDFPHHFPHGFAWKSHKVALYLFSQKACRVDRRIIEVPILCQTNMNCVSRSFNAPKKGVFNVFRSSLTYGQTDRPLYRDAMPHLITIAHISQLTPRNQAGDESKLERRLRKQTCD